MDKLRVSIPSIRFGLLISEYISNHGVKRTILKTTVLFCTVVYSWYSALILSVLRGVVQLTFHWGATNQAFLACYFLLACNQLSITGLQPTQPYRHSTCCFASVTMPHTLYTYGRLILAEKSIFYCRLLGGRLTMIFWRKGMHRRCTPVQYGISILTLYSNFVSC